MQNNTEKIEKDIHQLYELYNKLARWSKDISFYINHHEIRLQNLQSAQKTEINPYASYTPENSPRNIHKNCFFPGGKSRKKKTKKRKTRNRKKNK